MARPEARGIKVPPELHSTPHRVLEEYVRARVLQFSSAFASRTAPALEPNSVQQAAFDTLQSLPAPDYTGAAIETRDLQLVFRHDCQSLGCLDPQCVLCEHNPHRRCSVNFAPKYLVNDVLRAKCEAPIRVEVIDRATGQPLGEDVPGVALELCILDGNQYDTRCADSPGEERAEDLDACALLLNNKASALLVPGPGGSHNSENKVIVPLVRGAAVLPELHVSDSSEALLSGRKPPFRLLARAVAVSGGTPPIPVRSAVSEGFVVATRRTRTAGKVEIPNVDDHVGKLEHMGRETVKKLQDIRGSAYAAGVDIQVPDNCINKVGEFRKLALLAEADGHLRQKLQQVLKLSKEKWEEARDHAMRAVVADNRMRIWYADKGNMELGLLFTCRLGTVDLDRPVGLLTKKASDGNQTTMEATLMAQQTPAQRDQVRILQPQAAASWWQPGHPGWAIYPVDSDQFLSTGALDQSSLPAYDQTLPLPGGTGAGPGGQLPGLPTAFAPFMGPGETGMSNEALLRALGVSPLAAGSPLSNPPFLPGMLGPGSQMLGVRPPGGPPATTSAEAGGASHTPFGFSAPQGRANGGSHVDARGGHTGASAFQSDQTARQQNGTGAASSPTAQQQQQQQHAPGVTSAFASVSTAKMDVAPSLNLGNLQSLLGPDFKLPWAMSNFPSLPSGDLEAMLAAHGGDPLQAGGRLPSLMLGRLTSMELGLGTGPPGAGGKPSMALSPGEAGGGGVKRQHSGLESMQSIDQALQGVEAENPHAAMDAAVALMGDGHQDQKRAGLAGSKRK